MPELALELRPLRHGLFVDVDEHGPGRDAPRQIVRVVLRRRKHDLVVGREAQRSRDEIERIGRVAREHDLGRLRADQRGDAVARALVLLGRRFRERIEAAVDVRAERFVVARDGGDDLARLRRRRRAVEVDERRAVVAVLEQRKPGGPHQRLTSRYFPDASGAIAATRSPRIGRASSAPTACRGRAALAVARGIDDEQVCRRRAATARSSPRPQAPRGSRRRASAA